MMDRSCNIIRDLLPLYADGVCSEDSRKLVEDHISSCTECARMLGELKNNAPALGLMEEREGVIQRQEKRMRKRGFTAGMILSAIMMIPILVCFIVNIAAGHALDWFFIVLASLALFASLTVVPLMSGEHKFNRTFVAFTGSLILLLGVCALYSGGKWFFVASSSVLFGLSLTVLPFAVRCEPLKSVLKNSKAITVFAADVLLLAAMFVSIGYYIRPEDRLIFLQTAAGIAFPVTVATFVMLVIARYTRIGKAEKAGLCLGLAGIASFFFEYWCGKLLNSTVPLPECDFGNWAENSDGNVKWIILIVSTAMIIISVVSAIVRKGKKK